MYKGSSAELPPVSSVEGGAPPSGAGAQRGRRQLRLEEKGRRSAEMWSVIVCDWAADDDEAEEEPIELYSEKISFKLVHSENWNVRGSLTMNEIKGN